MQDLFALGWGVFFQKQLEELDEPGLTPGRVTIQHRDLLRVLTEEGEVVAAPRGRLRHENDATQIAAVGDWVALGPDRQVVHHVFRRRSAFVRQAAQDAIKEQVIAANIDTAFVVTSCNSDFNPRRIERYVTAVWDSGARPVVVLNKADLCEIEGEQALDVYVETLGEVTPGVDVLAVSAERKLGLEQLAPYLATGKTVVLVGSSGVGKSTLVNALTGGETLATAEVRSGDDKGRHTTTHRELIVLPEGGMLIDTPGMREFRLRANASALGESFSDIESLAEQCRFNDCQHESEPGCAVVEEVSPERLASYRKLEREVAYENQRRDASARREREQRWRKVTIAYRQRAKLGGKLEK